jgi:predicted enzyme related to lactoylglutathione lyase
MITGAHAIIYSNQADEARAFLQDVIGFKWVDAGDGWLVFALPPAELAVHPLEGEGRHELFLMCDDISATVEALTIDGAVFSEPTSNEGWGLRTSMTLPGGVELGLYEPRHPTALA